MSGTISKHITNLQERGTKVPRISKANRKKKIIAQMKSLGNYKEEYDDAINVYLDLIIQYETFSKEFEKSGYKISEEYTNKAGATNQRKVPLLTALETLRKDIITYSDRLRLNPKADSVELEPETNKGNLLAQFLQSRSDDK